MHDPLTVLPTAGAHAMKIIASGAYAAGGPAPDACDAYVGILFRRLCCRRKKRTPPKGA